MSYIPASALLDGFLYFFAVTQTRIRADLICCSTPDPGSFPIDVIDLYPTIVLLVYNCHYMTAICKNAANFERTDRGMDPHPNSGIPSGWYGYDFNTAPGGRSDKRRSRSCPSYWKDEQICPHSDQAPIFRHDGQWWTTDISDRATNYIRDEHVHGKTRPSNI
jgi:hypothetical protein